MGKADKPAQPETWQVVLGVIVILVFVWLVSSCGGEGSGGEGSGDEFGIAADAVAEQFQTKPERVRCKDYGTWNGGGVALCWEKGPLALVRTGCYLKDTGEDVTIAVVTERGTGSCAPVVKTPAASDGLGDEMAIERVVNRQWGVRRNRDSGATCEQTDRRQKRYGCSILKGDMDIATGIRVTCPKPVTSRSVPIGCRYREMTPRQRCLFGVRSGIPGTPLPSSPAWVVRGIEIWHEEAVICRRLGVPIE